MPENGRLFLGAIFVASAGNLSVNSEKTLIEK